MWLLDELAEARIGEAIRNGMLDDLPGQGKPLHLADDRYVPEELRAAYRVIKNSGYLPAELGLHGEIQHVEALLLQATRTERERLSKKLNYLLLKLSLARNAPIGLRAEQAYLARADKRVAGPK